VACSVTLNETSSPFGSCATYASVGSPERWYVKSKSTGSFTALLHESSMVPFMLGIAGSMGTAVVSVSAEATAVCASRANRAATIVLRMVEKNTVRGGLLLRAGLGSLRSLGRGSTSARRGRAAHHDTALRMTHCVGGGGLDAGEQGPSMRLFRSGFDAFMVALLTLASPAMAGSQPAVRYVAIGFRLDVYYSVYNRSDACAWITTYWSYKSEAHWRIDKARWVGPHQSARGHIGFNFAENKPQVRQLAEIRPTAQCNGSGGRRVQTQQDFRQFPTHPSYQANLLGSKSSGYRWETHYQ